MRVVVRELLQYAERCVQLSEECQNKKASKFLRLLAVDLILAAEQRRLRTANRLRGATSDKPVSAYPASAA